MAQKVAPVFLCICNKMHIATNLTMTSRCSCGMPLWDFFFRRGKYLHEIAVYSTGAKCTCNWDKETPTGSSAKNEAWTHAQKQSKAIVTDTRTLDGRRYPIEFEDGKAF